MNQTRSICAADLSGARDARVMRLQYEVARLLAHSETAQDALIKVLKKIVESGGWDAGVFWSADGENMSYRCEWHKPGFDATPLLTRIQAMDSSLFASLPGMVMQTGDLVWREAMILDVRTNPTVGSESYNVLALPLNSMTTIQGVIGLFRTSGYDIDDGSREVFKLLGGDIGQFLQARRNYQKRLEALPLHDELTGLTNQTLLLDRGRQALLLAERNDSSLAVLHIDLDFSKPMHGEHDDAQNRELILLAAERLSSCVRAYDTVSKLANNEFLVLLPEMFDSADALVVAKKIISVMTQSLTTETLEVAASVTVGIARYPQDGFDMPTLLQQAETALGHAKSLGGNQCTLYGELA